MKDWRLVEEVAVYVISENSDVGKVYIAPTEKKSYENAILTEIYCYAYDRILFLGEESKFKVKIDKEFNILIQSPKLPEGEGKYYKIMNSYYDNKFLFGEIFTQVENNKGDFGDFTFEPIFSESYPGKVFIANDSMDIYKSALKEMRRRLSCQICKKTKKWIPGHRYESESTTYYYLGNFSSRKSGEGGSDFLEDDKVAPVHLFISEIDERKVKNISDVFENYVFGSRADNIQVIYKENPPLAVDSGQALVDDVKDIQDYWPSLVNNTISKYKKNVEDNPYYIFTSDDLVFKYLFDIFSIQSPGNLGYYIDQEIWNSLKNIITDSLEFNIVFLWNISTSRSDSTLSSTNTVENNTKNLKNLFFRNMKESNIRKISYYQVLFDKLGLPKLEDIGAELLKVDVVDRMFSTTFDNYIKYGNIYYDNHDRDKCLKKITQRKDSTNYTLKFTTLNETFSAAPYLEEAVRKTANKAISNYGLGVKSYQCINIGTRKNPMVYTSMSVSVDDIVNYYGGIDKVPDEVVRDIKLSHFWSIDIDIDRGKEVE